MMNTDSTTARPPLSGRDIKSPSHGELASPDMGRLLESILDISSPAALGTDQTPRRTPLRETDWLNRFLAEPDLVRSIRLLFGPGPLGDRRSIARRLNVLIARIDHMLESQLNEILHHPDFQQLEAGYRSLWYLVGQAAKSGSDQVKICCLNLSWKELVRDLERASEFDQSQLFKKVYEERFGTAGGEPFGVLIGNYEIRPRPSVDHPTDDIAALRQLSQIAAAAFCPFVAGAHPSMFGVDQMGELAAVENLERGFESPEFLKWRTFRETEDARFVALTVPHILLRLPYERLALSDCGFLFQEHVAGPDARRYLWGNSAFAFGAVLIRNFAQFGWLSDIRGVVRDVEAGGLVTDLPAYAGGSLLGSSDSGISLDVLLSEKQDLALAQLGFLPLVPCQGTNLCAFYTSQSVQKPKVYQQPAATDSARMSAMLNYTFCVSRFAHFIKALAREKIGSFRSAEECGRLLQNWIIRYVTPDESATAEAKARRPLKEASIEIKPQPGKPGSYLCVIRLCPHYQFEAVNASIVLRTQVAAGTGGPATGAIDR